MRKVVFFDLDSTLLQMNQDLFLKLYFAKINEFSKKLGYDDEFFNLFMKAAYLIIKNDGSKLNEAAFWDVIATKYKEIDYLKEKFTYFYDNEFPSIESIVQKNSLSRQIVETLKNKGYRLILATNPVFPLQCTKIRMSWAGLDESMFEYITTYENSHYAKPSRGYFNEILANLNLSPEEVVMVGNDLHDDFDDLPDGIDKILITDFIINKDNKPITMPSYTLEEFYNLIK